MAIGWSTAPDVPSETRPLPILSDVVIYTGGDAPRAVLDGKFAGRGPIAVDIEGMGLGSEALKIKCVSVATADRVAVLDPRRSHDDVTAVREIVGMPDVVYHNSMFDVPSLVHSGVAPDASTHVRDTLVPVRIATPPDRFDPRTRSNLDSCIARYLDVPGTTSIVPAKRLGTKASYYARYDLHVPTYRWKAAADAVMTARLWPAAYSAAITRLQDNPFVNMRTSDPQGLVERELTVLRTLLARTVRGFVVRPEALSEWDDEHADRVEDLAEQLEREGVTPGNANTLVDVIGASLPSDWPRTPKTGRPSTKADLLEGLAESGPSRASRLAGAFVEWKRLTKLRHDYLGKGVSGARKGRIHPTVSILAAATGRMSYSDPPLQQYTGVSRGVIAPDPGDSLVSIDWSQIEPVIMALIARQQDMIEHYEDGSGDVYTTVAAAADVERKTAKVILLAQMYGQGTTSLAASLGVTYDEATALRQQIMSTMPKVSSTIRRVMDLGERRKVISTVSGRVLPIPVVNEPTGDGGYRKRLQAHKAVNYLIQGSAYDVLSHTIARCADEGLGAGIYLAMHDELVVSASIAERVQQIMSEAPAELARAAGRVPVLRVDSLVLGDRWAEA